MGGGRVMATAAKVAGIGVAKGGFRGGLGFPSAAAAPSSNDQFILRSTSVSKPVSASVSSVTHPSSSSAAEDDAVMMRKPVWEDEWEFAEVEPATIPRVVFSKPPSLQEAKEATDDLKDAINMVYMEGSNELGSVSRMFSSFQSSENRAVESPVPQVALNAFAFLSENSAAQSVVASIASDPKVWDAVMENKDLMKFLETNSTADSTQVETDNDDKSEDSSEAESEDGSEAKPIEFMEILRDMKLKAVQLIENVSSYFGGLFKSESFTKDGEERKRTLLNDPTSLFGLAVCVIFMLMELAGFEEDVVAFAVRDRICHFQSRFLPGKGQMKTPPCLIITAAPCGEGLGKLVVSNATGIYAALILKRRCLWSWWIVTTTKKVPLELVDSDEMVTVGGSHGWVATLKDNGLVRLQDDLNPFASDTNPKRIPLPPLVTLPHCQTHIVTNMAMSSSSPEDQDCVVALKFLGPQLSFCRPAAHSNSSEWINIRIATW